MFTRGDETVSSERKKKETSQVKRNEVSVFAEGIAIRCTTKTTDADPESEARVCMFATLLLMSL